MPGEPPGSSDPLDPAGLVGRAAEAAAIRRMLDGAPLVTVTGPGGVGKTRVALRAAAELSGEPLEREDLLATLIGLVDKSVVLRADGDGARYLLLETIDAAIVAFTRLIRVMRLIEGIPVPRINHEARIDHDLSRVFRLMRHWFTRRRYHHGKACTRTLATESRIRAARQLRPSGGLRNK